MTEPNESDIIVVPDFDDRVVRRAMRRGVVRTGLVAALCLALVLAMTLAATAVISTLRTQRFFTVAVDGMRVAHPEYEIAQDGSCCGAGPLGGLTNLGLASEVRLRLRPLGALNYTGSTTVMVEQDVDGDIHVGDLDSQTPLGEALRRGRPAKDATKAFLSGLPETTAVSALVELAGPNSAAAFAGFTDRALPVTEVPNRRFTVYVCNPYVEQPITWPNQDLAELGRWASSLTPADDDALGVLGLPQSVTIQSVVLQQPAVYAFVVSGIPVDRARDLLADPGVQSVNILDVAFNLNRQTLP